VTQALHWFDLNRFYPEVERVLKPNGTFAASAYRFFHITPAVDDLVNRRFYDEIVGPFWPPERALIMNFEQLPFPFPELKTPAFEMNLDWTLDQLLGYLRSWSATQRFIAANTRDPLEEIMKELKAAWGEPQQSRKVSWSLALRVGAKSA
jgi:SAM-dependent methyltransferase